MAATNRSRVLCILNNLEIPHEIVKSPRKKPDRIRFSLPGRTRPVTLLWKQALEELTRQAIKDGLVLPPGAMRI